MSIFELIKFRVRQTVAGERSRGLVKFLAPDILIGIFLGISSDTAFAEYFPARVAAVAACVALFTSLAETRKFFYFGGDVERFYFVRPTVASRVASVSGMIFLNLMITAAIFVPAALLSPVDFNGMWATLRWMPVSMSLSVSLYFLLLFLVAILRDSAANRFLTGLQVVMALAMLAVFQLSPGLAAPRDPARFILVIFGAFIVVSAAFMLLPVTETIVDKLGRESQVAIADLARIAEKLKRPLFIRSEEEEAGFMFLLANLFRSSQFRLSTIGVAGTPVMVAVYWSTQGIPFMNPGGHPVFYDAQFVAPLASLVVSGIVIYYFISQNVLSSRDYEAAWIFDKRDGFNAGRFVLGVRKGILICTHLPVTALIFLVSLFVNPPAVAFVTAATYYLMVHVAASWFSAMQRRFPFSVPFTPMGVTETANLVFMLAYSFLAIMALFISYGNAERLLMVNLLAFILVGVLEYSSVGIVNRRVQASA